MCVDVRFLPTFCNERVVVVDPAQEGGRDHDEKKKAVSVAMCSRVCVATVALKVGNRRLDMAEWQMAWDRYMLAAHATGQFKVCEGMKHKEIVQEVAMSAGFGKGPLLGSFYDDIAR